MCGTLCGCCITPIRQYHFHHSAFVHTLPQCMADRTEQQVYWNAAFVDRPGMFGSAPSAPAREASALFEREGVKTVLELGGGLGRDTVYFASQGFSVVVLDYAESSIAAIVARADESGLDDRVDARR